MLSSSSSFLGRTRPATAHLVLPFPCPGHSTSIHLVLLLPGRAHPASTHLVYLISFSFPGRAHSANAHLVYPFSLVGPFGQHSSRLLLLPAPSPGRAHSASTHLIYSFFLLLSLVGPIRPALISFIPLPSTPSSWPGLSSQCPSRSTFPGRAIQPTLISSTPSSCSFPWPGPFGQHSSRLFLSLAEPQLISFFVSLAGPILPALISVYFSLVGPIPPALISFFFSLAGPFGQHSSRPPSPWPGPFGALISSTFSLVESIRPALISIYFSLVGPIRPPLILFSFPWPDPSGQRHLSFSFFFFPFFSFFPQQSKPNPRNQPN